MFFYHFLIGILRRTFFFHWKAFSGLTTTSGVWSDFSEKLFFLVRFYVVRMWGWTSLAIKTICRPPFVVLLTFNRILTLTIDSKWFSVCCFLLKFQLSLKELRHEFSINYKQFVTFWLKFEIRIYVLKIKAFGQMSS